MPLLKILIVALSLALDVFAVSVGVGIRGVSSAVKIRIGIAFALAEIVMNVLGAGLGALVGRLLGDVAGYIGFGALIGLGAYMIYESLRDLEDKAPLDMSAGWGLFIASLSISLDSLGIGFSILYIGVPVVLSLTIIGVVSIAATTLGLTLGRLLGKRAEEGSELWAGIVLAATGIAFIAFKATGHG
ncbi:MAG: manganese efflux pump MntP family protein [Candidatus Eremiobacteraeota bacterium]|nr:manganese efflux pump MntP family protein [Candidatus Eremiobacteraeota bacterium]